MQQIATALAEVRRTGECWWEPELLRIRGTLLWGAGDGAEADAESSFRCAIDFARRYGARVLELRAIVSLAHLQRDDEKKLDATRRLLSNEQRSGYIDRLSDTGKVLVAFYVPADFSDYNLDVVAYVPRILTQSFRRAEKLVLAQFAKVRNGEFDDATLPQLVGLQAVSMSKNFAEVARNMSYHTENFSHWCQRSQPPNHRTILNVGLSLLVFIGLIAVPPRRAR